MASQQTERTGFERRLQTAFLALTLTLVGWGSSMLFTMSTRLAVMEESLSQLRSAIADRYTGAEARLVNAEVMRRIERNEQRIDRLEQRGRNP